MEPKKNIKSNKKPPVNGQQAQQHQNRKANRANKKKKNNNQQQQTKQTTTTTTSPTATTVSSVKKDSTSPSSTPSTSPSGIASPILSNSTTSSSNSTPTSTSPIISPNSSSSIIPTNTTTTTTTTTTSDTTTIEEELSIIEKENLNKQVLDIKKKDHAHKKEKQKKLEERKKILNESIQKKHEQQKQLKKEEEEKKKQLEKERIESQKEINQKLNELAKTNPHISSTLGRNSGLNSMSMMGHSISSSNLSSSMNHNKHSGTISKKGGFGTVSDERLLEVLKKKQQMGTIGPNSAGNSNNNSLRKYSSHNSIGIKSGGLFRTISIPRLSKQQISVLDVFGNGNGSASGSVSGGSSKNISPNTSTSNLSTSLQHQAPGHLSTMFSPPGTGSSNSLTGNIGGNNNNNNGNGTINNHTITSLQHRSGSISGLGSSSNSNSNSTSSHLNALGQFTFKNFIPNSTRKNHLNDSFKTTQRQSLKDDFFSPHNTNKRWEEYVKTILPTEQELIKEKKELEKQRELQEQELVKQQLLLQAQQATSNELTDDENESDFESDEIETTTNDPSTNGSTVTNLAISNLKSDSPRKSISDSPRKSIGGAVGRLLVEEAANKTDSSVLSEKDIETLSPFKKIEKQEKNDGDRFIKALLNKTPIATKTAYSMNVGGSADNSTVSSNQSQKPIEIVNIFKYGSIDIDFTEIFGEAEDLQGFIMWSVNGFTVEERDYDDYATLYNKDSYLVFNVSLNQKDSNMYNIHIWNGKDTSIDKKGTAVMMAIQLSTHLGGKVNHYTEEQGKESEMFTQYFHCDDMNGIKYKIGGSDSDFFSTKQLELSLNKKYKLYKIDIPPVELDSCASISIRRMGLSRKLIQDSSSEISWILVNHQNCYLKFGSKSSLTNRITTREISRQFENYYSKACKLTTISDEKEFCKLIKQYKSKEDRDKDYKYSEDDETIVNLYKTVLKANGKLGLEQIAEEYPIQYSVLNELDQVYILDCTTDIFIWCPKGVSKKKVAAAKECAKVFFKEYDRPEWAEISKISQGNEPPYFKRQFRGWPLEVLQLANIMDPFKLAELRRSNISSDKLYYDFHYINFTCRDELILPLYESYPTDKVDCYGVTLPDLQFFKLEPEEKSHFYEDDCFMIMVSSRKEASPYAVNQNDITQTVIYWWEGVTADNRGFAMFIHGLYPIIAAKFVEQGQSKPTVYLATQRKEPTHFLKSFDETMVIHKGSRFDDPEICHKVYQFINEGPNTYIQQLDQNSVILNSYNVYFIRSAIEGTITIWKGAYTYTPMDELESFATRLDSEFKIVTYEQGQEPNHFWDKLPGVKNSIPMDMDLSNDSLFKFYLSPESQVKMTRINRKYSSDLKSTECCLLDSPDVLYVWIGSNCSQSLENIVMMFVHDYCKYYSIPEDSIAKVIQYNESIEFKLRFKAWDRKEEWVDPHETRQCQVALQKTLLYRKQYEEEQQLFKEYLEYAYSLSDDDELEDFETWTLIKKGYLDDHGELNLNYYYNGYESDNLQTNGNNNNNQQQNNNNNNQQQKLPSPNILSPSLSNKDKDNHLHQSPVFTNNIQQPIHSKNNGLPPLPKSSKKKKFFGLFKATDKKETNK